MLFDLLSGAFVSCVCSRFVVETSVLVVVVSEVTDVEHSDDSRAELRTVEKAEQTRFGVRVVPSRLAAVMVPGTLCGTVAAG